MVDLTFNINLSRVQVWKIHTYKCLKYIKTIRQGKTQLIMVSVKLSSLSLSIFCILVKLVCIKAPEPMYQLLHESGCIDLINKSVKQDVKGSM